VAAPAAVGAAPTNGSGGVSGASTVSSGHGGPPGAAGATAPSGLPLRGQGWDAQNVYVGIIVETDEATVLSHQNAISLNPGDEVGDAKAIIADLNRRGGLFGRHISLVIKDDKTAAVIADPASAGQADCTYFTQDHPVIAVVDTTTGRDTDAYRRCFANAHTPLVAATSSSFDDTEIRAVAPYYYNALYVPLNHLTTLFVGRLQSQGYFGGWNTTTGGPSPTAKPKIGVLYRNDSTGSREGPALRAALQRAGYATDAFQWNSYQDGGSAVLRFEANGVTHVVSMDDFEFFFMTAARSQHYLPRYGVTTYASPQPLLESNGDPTQLRGALGLGWYPTLDVDANKDPGPGPGTNYCLAALRAGGQTFSGKRFAEAFGMAVCDTLRLGVLGAQAGSGLSPAAIRAGIVRLGASFPTGGSFASGLSQTDFGLPGAARDLGFDDGCSCFTYRGSTYRLP
jgi:hypothetical protein